MDISGCTLIASGGERNLGDKNERGQSEMEGWRDVGGCWRKDNSNYIRRPAAPGVGIIAFSAEKNNMKTGRQKRGNSPIC